MNYREFELITCEPFDGNNIAVFARTHEEDPERVRIDVTDFDPYFYAHASETEYARSLKEDQEEAGDPKIKRVIEGFETELDDEPLTKVVLYHPGDTREMRDRFSSPDHLDTETWESDINFTMRFRVDVEIKDVFKIPEPMLKEIGENHYEVSYAAFSPSEEDPIAPRRNWYFDIEVGGEDQVTPEEDDLNPIVSVTGFDSYTDELVTWVWRDDFGDNVVDDIWVHPDVDGIIDWEIRQFDSETKMLSNWFRYTQNNNVDVLSGWYSDKYDVPYLVRRAEELGLNPDVWSELNTVNDGLPVDQWGQAKVAGLFMNDLERRYDNIVSPTSSALDYVAAEEEDVMSWEQESGNIQEIWENDIKTLLQYNANDVIATWKVDDKAGITDFFFQKMYMTGCRVEEIENDSNVITYYLMFEGGSDEILPRAQVHTHKEFGGGRVLVPDIQGIVGPVAVLDLSKIYPSIMITLALSYENAKGVDPVRVKETVTVPDEMKEKAYERIPEGLADRATITSRRKENSKSETEVVMEWEFHDGDVVSPLVLGKEGRKEFWDMIWDMQEDGSLDKSFAWEFVDPVEQDAGDFPLPDDHTIDLDQEGTRLPNGVRIDMENDGLVTRTLEKMFELRYAVEEIKSDLDPSAPNYKERYDRLTQKRHNYKDQINAVFGYSGYKKSPLFTPEIAMTVTFVGRNILKMCELVAEELGHKVIYGDTDSIMVWLQGDGWDPEENLDEVVYESNRVGEIANKRMDDFAENFCGVPRDEHMFELEFEKLYSTFFVGDQKKRYAGLRSVTE